MNEQSWFVHAKQVLVRHGHDPTDLDYIGAGGQSVCYGTRDIAVLLTSTDSGENVDDLTGHVIPDNDEPITSNSYAVQQWLANHASDEGVRTPRILAVGSEPRPYALIERAHGTVASAHPYAADHAPAWFGQLGKEIRKTHLVEVSGFGMFVPDGSGGYRGRIDSWKEYLDRWLAVHLCVGRSRPADEKVLNLLLAQGIVTERDLALVAAKVREAQGWPVRSVLTHYDNRLDNVVVDGDEITMLDWGLSFGGIGIAQELIKLFEVAPTSISDPRVAAFLHGYGLSETEGIEAVENGKLMLLLDGLGMSYGWADIPERLDGIRGWLRTVKRTCESW